MIAIAHRLDHRAWTGPIVLDHGRIVEQGSHEALLKHNGHYAALWRQQSGGFIDVGQHVAAE